MDDTTFQLIGVYNEIEGWMRTSSGASQGTSFVALVSRASRSQPSVRRHVAFLKTIAEFRNFLVHEHKHPHALAAATPDPVERLTRIRDELFSPPLLLAVSNRPVVVCRPSDPVGRAANGCYGLAQSKKG